MIIVFDGALPRFHREASLVYMGILMVITIISYVAPIYMAFRNYFQDSQNNSNFII
jgi:uncharacterized membrane protein